MESRGVHCYPEDWRGGAFSRLRWASRSERKMDVSERGIVHGPGFARPDLGSAGPWSCRLGCVEKIGLLNPRDPSFIGGGGPGRFGAFRPFFFGRMIAVMSLWDRHNSVAR